jgi:trehalose 6-phosphate synthase
VRRKLIVASNRGPVTYAADGSATRGAGGLVTALSGLVSHHDVTWIASAMSDADRARAGAAFEETARDGSSYRMRFVAHEPAVYDAFYNEIANPMLWFVQHYLWDLAREPSHRTLAAAWERGYVPVNRAFADAVLEELAREPDAVVFFHDYHLYVAPRLVRDARPDAALSQFVHIPWPQPDYWTVLPAGMRRAIHRGVLANDVVSFHTRRWRRSFLRACEDFVGARPDYETHEHIEHEGRRVRVTARPISVDAAEFETVAASDAVLAEEAQIVARRPEKLVLRVDRTEPSKNAVRGFEAFELYLEAHPEMHRRVGMLALLTPSRQDIPHYAEYTRAIEDAVARVNVRFGAEGWLPVELIVEDRFARSVAAYKQYDVLLVNPVFDGLNLIAKEAPLVNERDGVLVLSENAGAYEELAEWAIGVNPFDVGAQADAIHRAVSMAAGDRRERLASIRAHVRRHDLAAWSEAQLADLELPA